MYQVFQLYQLYQVYQKDQDQISGAPTSLMSFFLISKSLVGSNVMIQNIVNVGESGDDNDDEDNDLNS